MPADETFTERFARSVAGRSDTEVGAIMGITADAARKLRTGDIKSLKLGGALRLCRRLGISPWELAGERPPLADRPDARIELEDGTSIMVDVRPGPSAERSLPEVLDLLRRPFGAQAKLEILTEEPPTRPATIADADASRSEAAAYLLEAMRRLTDEVERLALRVPALEKRLGALEGSKAAPSPRTRRAATG